MLRAHSSSRWKRLGWAAPLILLAAGAVGAEDHASGAAEIAQLRTEVDALAQGVRRERESLHAERLRLEAQRGVLEQQIRQEEIRLASLEQLARERESRARAQRAESAAQAPALLAMLGEVRSSVAASIPYRRSERLAALDELERALRAGTLAPVEVAERLWQLVEDERTLTGEVALGREPVELAGARRLSEVLHVGMGLLYVRTPSGEVGWAVPEGADYRWEVITDAGLASAVSTLFDRVSRGQNTGGVALPLPPHLRTATAGGAP